MIAFSIHRCRAARMLALLAALLLAISGCTTLPPRLAPPESRAYADTAATPLGRVRRGKPRGRCTGPN